MNKILSNYDIYIIGKKLESISFDKNRYLPARINFFILKNKKVILELAQQIEELRIGVIRHYGVPQEDGSYIIPNNLISEANQEINDLFSINQEINILSLKISDLEGLEFTFAQMDALMFMIEE